MRKDPSDLSSYRTVREVARDLKLPALRRLISQGRLPFIVKLGCAWMLPRESVEFLREHYSGPRLHGLAGKALADEMRKLAARLDPACAARQRAWRKMYGQKTKSANKR